MRYKYNILFIHCSSTKIRKLGSPRGWSEGTRVRPETIFSEQVWVTFGNTLQ